MKLAALAFAALATACMPETVAPPVAPVLLESPSVLDRGKTGIQGSVGASLGTGLPPADAWSVRARRGFGSGVEGSIEATYLHVAEASAEGPAGAASETLRVGVRYRLWENARHRMATFFAGAGGGAFDRGTLFGADLGILLGSDVLFFAARVWASGTIGAAAVDDGYYTPWQFCILFCSTEPPTHYRNVPVFAGGLDTMLGLHGRIVESPSGNLELVVAGGPAQIFGAQYHLGFTGGGALEYVF